MKKRYVLISVLVVSCGLYWYSQIPRSRAARGGLQNVDWSQVSQENKLKFGTPISHANLTIFPLIATEPCNDDRFITLDEGMAAGTVEILEAEAVDRGAGHNQVDTLYVTNRSDKPLFLMPGEILMGGDQDRTIGCPMVIKPTTQPEPIKVFCVEQGRWGNRHASQTESALATADNHSTIVVADGANGDLAADANEGKFVASVGNLTKSARLAVAEESSQSEVWNEVAKSNQLNASNNATDTFTANYVDKDSAEKLTPYLDALAEKIKSTENVVGVVVAINGKVETIDSFESTPLFRKLWPKLLKSYALDALTTQDGTDHESCSLSDAQDFAAKVFTATSDPDTSETTHGLHFAKKTSTEFFCGSTSLAPPSELDVDSANSSGQFTGRQVQVSGFAK